jgi:hypothetical protein
MEMPEKVGESHDTSLMARLYAIAEPQCGMLTASQAIEAGVARSSLEYHARPSGQLERCGRGLYRLRRFPRGEHSHLWCAYLPLAAAGAVISHLSALWLLGLYGHAPDSVHLTLPRTERWRSAPRGVQLHFAAAPPADRRVVVAYGLPTSAPEVAIAAAIREQGLLRELEVAASLALIGGHTSLQRLRLEWPSTLLEVFERIARVAVGDSYDSGHPIASQARRASGNPPA